MFSVLMFIGLILVTWMSSVAELVEQAGLLNVRGPDGSVRWGMWISVLSAAVLLMAAGASGLMCILASGRLLTPSVRLINVPNGVIALVGGSYFAVMTVLKVA